MSHSGVWECEICNFKTDRETKYNRHVDSTTHKNLQFLFLENELVSEDATNDDEIENGIRDAFSFNLSFSHVQDDHYRTVEQFAEPGAFDLVHGTAAPEIEETDCEEDAQNPSPQLSEWYPFNSQAELLMYVFMNSPTHPVSEEVVKFVLYILEQLDVQDIPTLSRLKEKKFGVYSWENLVKKGTSKDNTPVWILKPSEILKLNVANPIISKKLVRESEASRIISHASNGQKWKEMNVEQDSTSIIPIVTAPMNLFVDDTSAHKSRRWMPLHCVQMQLSGLPLSDRHKQEHIHFLGASEKADIMDLARVVSDDISYLKTNGVPSFDATTGKNCIVKSCLDTVVADFQMLSHCCNHLGATALKYCPRCNVDRDHYMMLGVQRTPRQTKTICQRINIRSTEKEKKIMRKRYGVKEHDNVFWDLLDPHRDIPVGLLHLIPLGLAKHLIKTVIKPLDSTALTKMSCHLEALYPGSKFHDFFRYIDSRQGKDFKEYLQVAPFNMLYAGVQRRYIQMVSTLAAIQQKLNQSKFSESDIESLREDVRFYHQLIEENSPELKNKVKTHLLLHMIEDISRHGPPTGYDEDSFEKNHATIRNLLFLQNQKARSRDTSIKFAKNYLCRHVLSGGYFEDQDTWKQASINVQNIGEQQQIKKFLGLARAKEPKRRAGSVTMLERHQNKHPILTTQSEDVILHALITLNIETNVENYSLNKGNAVTAQNKDLIHKGEWLRYLDENMQVCFGVLKNGLILRPRRGSAKFLAIIYKSNLLAEKKVGCPVVKLSSTISIIETMIILEKPAILHDCVGAKCRVVDRLTVERVEQEDVSKQKMFLKHNERHQLYLLNKYKC